MNQTTNQPTACIFVADDDEDDRFLLAHAFTKHSPECSIQFFFDGLALLAALENAQPQLIILDLNMPRLNGFETLDYLRTRPQYDDTPIVILTTSEAESDRQRARALGADLFVTKPIDGFTLGQTVLKLRAEYLVGRCS